MLITDIKVLIEELQENKGYINSRLKSIKKELNTITDKNKKAEAERISIRNKLRGSKLPTNQRMFLESLAEKDLGGGYSGFQSQDNTRKYPTKELKSEIKNLESKDPFITIEQGLGNDYRYRIRLSKIEKEGSVPVLKRRIKDLREILERTKQDGDTQRGENIKKLLDQALHYRKLSYEHEKDDEEEEDDEDEEDDEEHYPLIIERFGNTIVIL